MTKFTLSKPALILLYGYPGSGKTHFSRQFCEKVNAAHVHGDRIRFELFDNPRFDAQENEVVEHIAQYMTHEFIKAGISVVFDMNATRLSERRRLRDMARKQNVKPLLIWFQVDADTAYSRASKRDKRKADDKYAPDISPDMFKQAAARMRNPDQTEDYIVVSGKHTFATQFSAVLRRMYEQGLVQTDDATDKVIKPGMVNLLAKLNSGRVDPSRRNIVIR